jgi:sugar lactone lactonase YvrE
MKKIIQLGLVLVALIVAYLLLWPVPIQPLAWMPPPAPSLEQGAYAYNEKLKDVEHLLDGQGIGPEGINTDSEGSLYAGYLDGRVMRISPDFSSSTELTNTGGRPLGIGVAANGSVYIADAYKGLLAISGGKTEVLSTQADGVPFGFTDDVAISRSSGNLYFTDASSRFGFGKHMADLLEHGANGRVLEYDPRTQTARTLIKGVHFANGITMGPDDAYFLVNETSEYRVLRYWLKGPRAGTREVFVDNLPGFPDNISFNGRDRFWVAIFAPRDALLDKTLPAGNEWLRKLVFRLPAFLQPKPRDYAFALGFDLDGKLVANLQYEGKGAYAPITSVREYGSWLYFGSLTNTAVGRLPLNKVFADAAAPAGASR